MAGVFPVKLGCNDRGCVCLAGEGRERKYRLFAVACCRRVWPLLIDNYGKASRYTRSRRPVQLVYHEAQPDKSSALRREAAIKALLHPDKDALIRRRRRKNG